MVEVTQAGPAGFGDDRYWKNLEKKKVLAEDNGDIVVVLDFWGMEWNKPEWRTYCNAHLLPVLVKYGITTWWEENKSDVSPDVSPEPVEATAEPVSPVEPPSKPIVKPPIFEIVIKPTADSVARFESDCTHYESSWHRMRRTL